MSLKEAAALVAVLLLVAGVLAVIFLDGTRGFGVGLVCFFLAMSAWAPFKDR